MIWHFLEVWLVVAVSFAVGCVLGAALYALLADSPLALAQGAVADTVGDVVDWVKLRLGIGPAWRPELARSLSRPGQSAVEPERIEPPLEFDRPPEFDEAREASLVAIALSAPAEREPPAAAVRRLTHSEPEARADGEPPPLETDRALVPATPGPKPVVTPMRPVGLSKPRGGVPDNLTRIRGIGQRNEEVLNNLGIFHFSQIAAWTPGEALWIGRYLAFPERIERDDWVGQAMLLATGGDTGFEKSADRRRKRRAEMRQRGAGDAAATSLALPPPSESPSAESDGDEDEDQSSSE